MSIDYEQLKTFVKEAMFTSGGINEPSAPDGVPHRMPAATTGRDNEQVQGDEEANRLYAIALTAREATEAIVEALDDPIFDNAYEHAFKASACMRRVLNSLEETGAHPMPQQRVVAPKAYLQRYSSGASAGDYSAGAGSIGFPSPYGLEESDVEQGAEAAAPAKPANQRAAKIAAAAGQGSTQSAEAIKQQLAAVLGADGISPMKLRDALISILSDLGVPGEKQIGTLIAKAVANKGKS